LTVATLAPRPNYTFNPANFPDSPRAQEIGRKLILPPGPNNPVGVYWVSLSQPGYGIHGTPKPATIGNMESRGCFRLCNWDAYTLGRAVRVGTPVRIDPSPAVPAENHGEVNREL
jgi:lipoprotein-anchoring transpeptidase ErfK/SrfK